MSEFKISKDFYTELTFRSSDNFIEIQAEVEGTITDNTGFFDLSIEQAKELISFLNDKIDIAENKK